MQRLAKEIKRLGARSKPAALALLLVGAAACSDADGTRLPAVAVNINLADAGLWATYGVAGLGSYRYFVRGEGEPHGFQYTAGSATGYGGVLLICCMDPFSAKPDVPLAFDMACPVECKPDVRVRIDAESLEAVCPVCGSRYNVLTGSGSRVGGPNMSEGIHYRLENYRCVAGAFGGYTITR